MWGQPQWEFAAGERGRARLHVQQVGTYSQGVEGKDGAVGGELVMGDLGGKGILTSVIKQDSG